MRPIRALALAMVAASGTWAGCAALSGFDGLEPCSGAGCDEPSDSSGEALVDGSRVDGSVDATTDAPDEVDSEQSDTAGDARVDSSVVDTGRADTLVADSGADTGIVETGIVDTGKIDTGTDTTIVDTGFDAGGCGGAAGPTMVKVSTFCIDSTEVTNTQYAAFLAAKGSDTTGQPSSCSWNTSYVPGAGWPAASTEGNYPVHSVDWCDAYMFCKWAGKRLCGAISGGPTPYAGYATSSSSQWMYACSANGTKAYPYGNTYDPTACEGVDIKPNKRVAVGSMPGCVGGYPGIYDMSGNVYEWEDSCSASTGATDNCRVRGGGIYSPFDYLTCSIDRTFARNTFDDNRGIRCCTP